MLNNAVAVFAAPVPPVTNSYESIATVTVGSGGSSSISFSSIPSTYKHLQIRSLSTASNGSYLRVQFNGDTGNNYSWHALYGNGASVIVDVGTTTSSMAGPSQGQSYPSSIITDILDYASTSKNKTARFLGGKDQNGSGNIGIHSGLWMNTAAITSITLFSSGVNFVQNDSFALYGIKG